MINKLLIVIILFLSTNIFYANDIGAIVKRFDNLLNDSPDTLFIKASELKKSSIQTLNKKEEAIAAMFIGFYYSKNGINDKCIESYADAEALMLELNFNDYLPRLYSGMGAVYRHLKDFKKANSYFMKALEPDLKIEDKLRAKVLNRIGDMQRDMGNIDSAFHYYFLSIEVSKITDEITLANNYNNIGDLFHKNNNFDSAYYYYTKSNSILIPYNIYPEVCENYYSIALLQRDFKQKAKAIEYLNLAFEIIENDSTSYELYNTIEIAVDIYNSFNMIDSVNYYLHKLLILEKKNSEVKLSKNINSIELSQQLNNQENEYRLLKEQSELKDWINYLLGVVVLLVIFVGFLFWKQIKLKKEENEILSAQNEQIRKQKEELQVAYDNINELNATKDKFFSIIAHDLKNPLGSFRELTKLLYDSHSDFSEEEKLEFLELMKDSAKNIYSLLENLLEWSRSQRGTIQFEPNDFPLRKLADNNLSLAKLSAENKKIKLINLIDEDVKVFIDPNLITTVFRNLISNAIKFTNINGSITIDAIKDGDFYIVSVIDTGMGMSQETMNKLFRIDVNVTTLGTSEEKGTGLGLILCKEFIIINGGRIWVESELEKGSKFKFTLPSSK